MISLFGPNSEAGSLVDQLPYWGFVHPDVIMTKAGELLFCSKLHLKSTDGAEPDELDRVTQAWQRLMAAVEPPHRVFVVYERRPTSVSDSGAPPAATGAASLGALAQQKRKMFVRRTLSDLDVWVLFCYNPQFKSQVAGEQRTWYLEYLRQWFTRFQRNPPIRVYLADVVENGIRMARGVWETVSSVVQDHTPLESVKGREYAEMLHRILNFRSGGWVLGDEVPHYGLSVRLADSVLAFERTHALIDHRFVGLYSLAFPPRRLYSNALASLYSKPWEFNAVLEWRPLHAEQVNAKIHATKKHYNNLRWSMFSAMTETEGSDMAVEDVGASAAIGVLDRATVELMTDGIPYGEIAFSFAVVGNNPEDLDARGAEINRAFVELDAKIVRERYAQAPVWFQRMPGSPRRLLPRPIITSSGQVATLAPLFGSQPGHSVCKHLSAPPLTSFKTRWGTKYNYDLFGGSDVGHTLVLGATGSGKSFTLNFLLLQSLQYNPRIVILDLGGSYRWVTNLVKGSYLAMSVEPSGEVTGNMGTGLRPFQLPAGERAYAFLAQWVSRILLIGGYQVEADDVNDIRERIIDVYKFNREERTLTALVELLPKKMWPALARWHGDGQWAQTFDGTPPTTQELEELNADWQVVDLAGAVNFPDWCEAALFFLLEKLRLSIDDDGSIGRLKIMVVDEGWHFLTEPAIVRYLAEAAKTWRKRNGVLVMATQSVADLAENPKSRALIESMPTRLFLSNPAFPPAAGKFFDLTPAEFNAVRELEAKREIFLHRSGGERAILCLDVDPESYWLYTSAATDAAKRAEVVGKYGLVPGIQRLAAGLEEDSAVDDPSLLLG